MKILGVVVLALAAAIGWAADAADSANGKKVYGAKCASCHGADGSGNPGIQKAFKVAPEALNLVDDSLKDEAAFSKVVEGGRGRMPAFQGKLTAAELADILAYLRSRKKVPETAAAAPAEGAAAAPAQGASAANGAGIYKAKCVSCHGAGGKGNPAIGKVFKLGPEALDLTDTATAGRTDAELAAVLRKGKGRMPAFTEKLADAEISALVAYIRSLSPAGSK